MDVGQTMSSKVETCRAEDSLATAARIMWDHDCGCVPVVAEGNRLIGIVTDRDIAMSALFSGCSLNALTVSDAMSKSVHACRPSDDLSVAESLMRTNQVRRLPVVDAEEHVVGILSLNDIARAYGREQAAGTRQVRGDEVADTLSAICRPHEHHRAAA